MNMKLVAQALRNAAHEIEAGKGPPGKFSCNAAYSAGMKLAEQHDFGRHVQSFYEVTLCPRERSERLFITDFSRNDDGSHVPPVEADNHRIVALCMAAAIAERPL